MAWLLFLQGATSSPTDVSILGCLRPGAVARISFGERFFQVARHKCAAIGIHRALEPRPQQFILDNDSEDVLHANLATKRLVPVQ